MNIEDLEPDETPLSEQEAANVKGGAAVDYFSKACPSDPSQPVLTARKAGKEQQEYLNVNLTEILIGL